MAGAMEIFKYLKKGETIQPRKFKEEFARLCPTFDGNIQQDTAEFLDNYLIEANSCVRKLFEVYNFKFF